MKKLSIVLVLIFTMLFFVSCASDDDDTDETNNQSDTASETDTDSPADTGSQSDTAPETDTDSPADTATDTTPETDTDSPVDTDTGDSDPVITPDGCTGFSFDSKIKFSQGIYVTKITDNLLGDHSLQDQLIIDFPENMPVAGSYDLASTSNKNYATCTECVLVLEDVNTSGQVTREYFQTAGTLTIDEVDDNYGIKGTVSAKLEEVTIDAESYLSTPVPNGKCVEIESGIFDNICVPDCEGKICGDNGCGGDCGEGCGDDLACSADQKSCVPFECEKVTLNQFKLEKMTMPSYYEYSSTLTPNIGESASDAFSFQVYYGEKMNKVWDLAGTKFHNCQLCLLIAEDKGATNYNRFYFQQKGTIDFSREPDKNSNFFNPSDGSINNVAVKDLRLIEVTLDTFDNTATPVPGGKCLEITNTTFNYGN